MMENRVAESHLLQWVFTNFEVTPQARVYKEDVFDAYVNVCVDAGTTPLAIDIFKRILQKVIPDARVFKRERKPSRTTKKNAAWSMRYIGNGSEFFEKSQTPSCDIMQDVVRSLTVLKPRDVFVSSTTEKRIRLCMFTEFLLDGLHVRKELTVYKTGRVKLVCGEKKLNPDDIGIPSRISKWRDLYLVTFFRFAVCQGYDSSEDSPGAVGLIHDMINHAAPVFYRMYSKACPGYLTYANDEDICDECFAESTKEPKEEQIPGQSTGEQLKSDKRNDDEDDEDDENDDMPGPSTSENPNLVPPIIIKYNPLLKVEVRKIPETRSMDDSDSENEQEPQKEKALDLRQNIHGPKQIIQNSKQTVLDVKQTIQTSEKTVHDPQQTIQDAKQTVHDPNQNVQEENTAAPDQPMDDVSDLDNDDFDDDPDSEIESGAQNLESVIDHIMEDCSNILQDEPSAVYLSAKKQDTQHSSQDFTKSTSEAISYKDTADPSSDIPIISNVTSLSIAEPVITRQPTNSTSLQAPVPVQPDPVSCESSATAAPAQKYTSAWYNVRQNENGSITFEYTPDLFGLHEVFLRINGELAKVAPFACMVTEDVGGNKYQYTPKWNIAVQAGTVQCSLVEAPAVPLPAADKSTPVSEEVPVIKQEPQSDEFLPTTEEPPERINLSTSRVEDDPSICSSKRNHVEFSTKSPPSFGVLKLILKRVDHKLKSRKGSKKGPKLKSRRPKTTSEGNDSHFENPHEQEESNKSLPLVVSGDHNITAQSPVKADCLINDCSDYDLSDILHDAAFSDVHDNVHDVESELIMTTEHTQDPGDLGGDVSSSRIKVTNEVQASLSKKQAVQSKRKRKYTRTKQKKGSMKVYKEYTDLAVGTKEQLAQFSGIRPETVITRRRPRIDPMTGQVLKRGQRAMQYFCHAEGCTAAFTNIFNFRRHTREHPNMKTLLCDTCGEKFTCKSGMNRHLLSHSEKRPFPCPEPGCGKWFKTTNDVSIHKVVHGEKKFLCPSCGMKFTHKRNCTRHVRLTHAEEGGESIQYYHCSFSDCDKRFKTQYNLKMHEETHYVEDIICGMCGLVCKNKRSHMVHTKRCIIKRRRLGLVVNE